MHYISYPKLCKAVISINSGLKLCNGLNHFLLTLWFSFVNEEFFKLKKNNLGKNDNWAVYFGSGISHFLKKLELKWNLHIIERYLFISKNTVINKLRTIENLFERNIRN